MRLSYIHTYIRNARHLTGKEKDKLQRRKVVVAKFRKVLSRAYIPGWPEYNAG
jgi:hypothetical protein